MGEWMSAEAAVLVPDDADLSAWLYPSPTSWSPDRTILGSVDHPQPPTPIMELLTMAASLGFEWEWDADSRLLTEGDHDLQVNYGLGDEFANLGSTLRSAGWGYRFTSAGKYELPGESWDWMPGWPEERQLTRAGEQNVIGADELRAAIRDTATHGYDLAQHLTALLSPWPGWTASSPAAVDPES